MPKKASRKMTAETIEQILLAVFKKAASGVWQTKKTLANHKELWDKSDVMIGNGVDRLVRKGVVERERVSNGRRIYHYRLVQREPGVLIEQELTLLRALLHCSVDDWLTKTALRGALGLSELGGETYIDVLLGRLYMDGLIARKRLGIRGKPWGYQITTAGRRALDPKYRGPEETKQEPAAPGWLANAILKTLLSRPEIGVWSIPELGGRLVVPCVGKTITAEDVTAACNALNARGLVVLWGEPSSEVSLNIPRGIGLDGQRLQMQRPVTTSSAPPADTQADLPARIKQLRLDYEAARDLARVELEARHAVEQELANEKKRHADERCAHDATRAKLSDQTAALAALTACFRGLFGTSGRAA